MQRPRKNEFLGTCKMLFMQKFLGIIIIPMEIWKFNIIAQKSSGKKKARFGSVFETIKLGSAGQVKRSTRLAKKEARIHHQYLLTFLNLFNCENLLKILHPLQLLVSTPKSQCQIFKKKHGCKKRCFRNPRVRRTSCTRAKQVPIKGCACFQP